MFSDAQFQRFNKTLGILVSKVQDKKSMIPVKVLKTLATCATPLSFGLAHPYLLNVMQDDESKLTELDADVKVLEEELKQLETKLNDLTRVPIVL